MASSFDHLQADIAHNPYPAYAQLRAEDPVHWSESLNGWMLTRHDDVMAAQRDRRLSADRATPFADHMEDTDRPEAARMGRVLARWMAFADPPRHTVLRRLTLGAFTPTAVGALRGRIETLTNELLDDLQGPEEDLLPRFAGPLPVAVIAEILGVPERDRARFGEWSDDLAAVVGGERSGRERMERGAASMAALDAYMEDLVAERRRSNAHGALVDKLIAARDADDALSEGELVANCTLLLFAGHETTTNLITSAVQLLLERPDQFSALRDDPSLAPNAVEEALRYEGAAHAIARVARENFELRGKRISKGDRVFLILAAANRDPEIFDSPEEFNIRRPPNRHMAFGYGAHFCVGAPLARLEGEVALTRLIARFPDMALVDPQPVWEPRFVLRGLSRLPLVMTSRPAVHNAA